MLSWAIPIKFPGPRSQPYSPARAAEARNSTFEHRSPSQPRERQTSLGSSWMMQADHRGDLAANVGGASHVGFEAGISGHRTVKSADVNVDDGHRQADSWKCGCCARLVGQVRAIVATRSVRKGIVATSIEAPLVVASWRGGTEVRAICYVWPAILKLRYEYSRCKWLAMAGAKCKFTT